MMPALKPSLTVFAENKMGGVQLYYSNLLRTGEFGGFDARYLILDHPGYPETKLTSPLEGAPSEIFQYGPPEDFLATLRRLARSLPAQAGLVLTNFELELGCLDAYRRSDLTVAYVCHDEGYVPLALRYAHLIDVFIAHNPYFAERLRGLLPAARTGDVHFVPFGIRQDPLVRRRTNPDRPLRVVFIGRLYSTKGVLELPAVDDRLRASGVEVQWSILGSGPEQENLERAVAGRDNFRITAPVDGPAMLRQAAEGDVSVLPSRLDGTPLAVMEAMSVGLVPVVSEFNPGARWMVPAQTGFVCPIEPAAMAAILARLHGDRTELEARSQASLDHARQEFDVRRKVHAYAGLFARWRELKRPAGASPWRYRSRLDQPWLPGPVAAALRRIRKMVSGTFSFP